MCSRSCAAETTEVLLYHKPLGEVTTRSDPEGRPTVFERLPNPGSGRWIVVGRLDVNTSGLLLFTNDPAWAARVTDPSIGPDKRYHVQIDAIPDEALLAALNAGVDDEGETLHAKSATVLRTGERTAWLEIVLDEGRNRQIRRMLAVLDIEVLRLVRVAIGPLELGDLAKSAWRELTPAEIDAVSP